jgi:hypothetical protein
VSSILLCYPSLSEANTDVVVQGHRFDIVEDIGCSAVVYMTPLAFPLYILWAPVLAAVSFIYAGKFSNNTLLSISS